MVSAQPLKSLSLDELLLLNEEIAAFSRAGIPLERGLTALGDMHAGTARRCGAAIGCAGGAGQTAGRAAGRSRHGDSARVSRGGAGGAAGGPLAGGVGGGRRLLAAAGGNPPRHHVRRLVSAPDLDALLHRLGGLLPGHRAGLGAPVAGDGAAGRPVLRHAGLARRVGRVVGNAGAGARAAGGLRMVAAPRARPG